MDRENARVRAWQLHNSYIDICRRDPEQEVQGIAFAMVDETLQSLSGFLGGDPVLRHVDSLMTPEVVAGGSVRVVDLLPVLRQVAVALGPEHPPVLPVYSFPPPPAERAF